MPVAALARDTRNSTPDVPDADADQYSRDSGVLHKSLSKEWCHKNRASMNVSSASPLTRKLGAFVALSGPELAALEVCHQRRRSFDRGVDLVRQGQVAQAAYLLADGWVCSYKILRKGVRQIVDFQIPGDFLGLRSVLFRTSDHNAEAMTKVEVSEISVDGLMDAFNTSPRLATAVLWAASRDEAMVVEHLVGVGRRNAVERTVHLLLELGARLQLVGLGNKEGYDCPLSQYMLADALGLTAVHINRIMRQLREEKLLTFRSGHVTYDDFEQLVKLADFDTAYLDKDGPLLR
jgi:CRP-like cAMP-binding protein